MLLFEEEIGFLPGFRINTDGTPGICFLWQHNWSVCQLLDYAHLHLPLLALPDTEKCCVKRQKEKLSVAVMAGMLLGWQTQIRHAPNGKPYIERSSMQISITHTDNIYGIGISRSRYGIDAESWGSKAYRLRHKFLKESELPLLDRLFPTHPDRSATALWSAKEAVYKAFDIRNLGLKEDITLLSGRTSETLNASFPHHNFPPATVTLYPCPSCIVTCCLQTVPNRTVSVSFSDK